MNVIELRDTLNGLIEQGHGELPVAYTVRTKMDVLYYEEFDRAILVADGSHRDLSGPLIELT